MTQSAETMQVFFNKTEHALYTGIMETVIDSDDVFYLAVSDA